MLSSKQITDHLKKIKGTTKVYTPVKYFKGLNSLKDVETRYKRILKGSKQAPQFQKFETDKGKTTKTSKYTAAFEKEYPNAKSLKAKSEVTGIPYKIIKEVYDKGLAAWGTGHRVGASGQQWGYARVHSFIMLGCTAYIADKYLLKEAIQLMSKKDIATWSSRKSLCPDKKHNIF